MKNIVLILLLNTSFILTAQKPTEMFVEESFHYQKFAGIKTLKSYLKKHKKNKKYRNAPCQLYMKCAFYLNEEGYVDSVSAFKNGQYDSTLTVSFFDEIELEIKSQCKKYRFYNQVILENDTTNMTSFLLLLDYECGKKGWTINERLSEYKKLRKYYKNIVLKFIKE